MFLQNDSVLEIWFVKGKGDFPLPQLEMHFGGQRGDVLQVAGP